MASRHTPSSSQSSDGAAFTWLLEHILTYPGTYEIPLRTMYTLNSGAQSPPTSPMYNAFPSSSTNQEITNVVTAPTTANLRKQLMNHIAQHPAQPTSLPPSFIYQFVRKCFSTELAEVDFPQALTALDYLKDLETRRRSEILAALTHLGVERSDVQNTELLKKNYPHAYQWVVAMEEKERKVEMLYTHVYLGLRRWTLVNEMSLKPFVKQNCCIMLNTLFPPQLMSAQFIPPTPALTSGVLAEQRKAFFRYIQGVEKNGTQVLTNVMSQHARPGEKTGWPKVRDDLETYLRMATSIIDDCLETTGRSISPRSANFPMHEGEDEHKRKVDSGISFGTSYSSNRSSAQSHSTRPSTSTTSTSSSLSTHSRQTSRDKQLPAAPEDEETLTLKPAGSALERIAREIRKIGSRSNMRDESRSRVAVLSQQEAPAADNESPLSAPARGLRSKLSLKNIRSTSRARSSSSNSRPASRNGADVHTTETVPTFDANQMRRQREIWESQQRGR